MACSLVLAEFVNKMLEVSWEQIYPQACLMRKIGRIDQAGEDG